MGTNRLNLLPNQASGTNTAESIVSSRHRFANPYSEYITTEHNPGFRVQTAFLEGIHAYCGEKKDQLREKAVLRPFSRKREEL